MTIRWRKVLLSIKLELMFDIDPLSWSLLCENTAVGIIRMKHCAVCSTE